MQRPTTWINSKIVCHGAEHTFFASTLADFVLHPVLEARARVAESSEPSSKSASKCGCIPVIFLPKNHCWSSLWRCSFHSDCCFVNNGFLSLITRWLCFVWVRARFLPGCENHLHSGKCGPPLQQRMAPNRASENRSFEAHTNCEHWITVRLIFLNYWPFPTRPEKTASCDTLSNGLLWCVGFVRSSVESSSPSRGRAS